MQCFLENKLQGILDFLDLKNENKKEKVGFEFCLTAISF